MTKTTETIIEADPKLPIIRMIRDFAATPRQLFRAHTDPVLFAQWVGPNAMDTRIEHWDARTGGSWRFVQVEVASAQRRKQIHGRTRVELSDVILLRLIVWTLMDIGGSKFPVSK